MIEEQKHREQGDEIHRSSTPRKIAVSLKRSFKLGEDIGSETHLYTIYSPPEHKGGIEHATKQDALSDRAHHFDGKTSSMFQ